MTTTPQLREAKATSKKDIEEVFVCAYTDLFERVEEDQDSRTAREALPKISEAAREQMVVG